MSLENVWADSRLADELASCLIIISDSICQVGVESRVVVQLTEELVPAKPAQEIAPDDCRVGDYVQLRLVSAYELR